MYGSEASCGEQGLQCKDAIGLWAQQMPAGSNMCSYPSWPVPRTIHEGVARSKLRASNSIQKEKRLLSTWCVGAWVSTYGVIK